MIKKLKSILTSIKAKLSKWFKKGLEIGKSNFNKGFRLIIDYWIIALILVVLSSIVFFNKFLISILNPNWLIQDIDLLRDIYLLIVGSLMALIAIIIAVQALIREYNIRFSTSTITDSLFPNTIGKNFFLVMLITILISFIVLIKINNLEEETILFYNTPIILFILSVIMLFFYLKNSIDFRPHIKAVNKLIDGLTYDSLLKHEKLRNSITKIDQLREFEQNELVTIDRLFKKLYKYEEFTILAFLVGSLLKKTLSIIQDLNVEQRRNVHAFLFYIISELSSKSIKDNNKAIASKILFELSEVLSNPHSKQLDKEDYVFLARSLSYFFNQLKFDRSADISIYFIQAYEKILFNIIEKTQADRELLNGVANSILSIFQTSLHSAIENEEIHKLIDMIHSMNRTAIKVTTSNNITPEIKNDFVTTLVLKTFFLIEKYDKRKLNNRISSYPIYSNHLTPIIFHPDIDHESILNFLETLFSSFIFNNSFELLYIFDPLKDTADLCIETIFNVKSQKILNIIFRIYRRLNLELDEEQINIKRQIYYNATGLYEALKAKNFMLDSYTESYLAIKSKFNED